MSVFAVDQVAAAVKEQCQRDKEHFTHFGWKYKKIGVQVSLVKETPKFYVVSVGHHDKEIWVEKVSQKFTVEPDGRDALIRGRVSDLKLRAILP